MSWSRRLASVVAAAAAALLLLGSGSGCGGKLVWVIPENISKLGDTTDNMFWVISYVTGALFVAVELLLVYFIIRYRYREGRKAIYTHGNNTLEMAWTIAPAVVLVFLALTSKSAWSAMKQQPPSEKDAFVVDVSGRQFEWRVRYPGPDGVFGRTREELIDKGREQLEALGLSRKDLRDLKLVDRAKLFGVDPADPAGNDDLVGRGNLWVPVNRPVLIRLRSQDGLHSFFLPHLRVKQDAVPGLLQDVYFEATKTGEYDIACAELCGENHFSMSGKLYVLTDDEIAARKLAPKKGEARP